MAVTKKTRSARAKSRAQTRSSRTPAGGQDAIALLKDDHREVEAQFEDYEGLTAAAEKKALAGKICAALRVHTQIEEELFYPAAREGTGDEDLLDEALVEHAGAKALIAEIEAMQPGEPLYDAKVKVLGEMIHHHVEEEEGELFPEVRKTKMDLDALGERMAARKRALLKPPASQQAG